MSYQNFIFDLYGTLVDIRTDENRKSFWVKCADLLSELGYPYRWQELKKEYGVQIELQKKKLKKHHEEPEVDLEKVFTAIFMKKGKKPQKALVQYFAMTFRVLSRDKLKLYQDSEAILKMLKENRKKIYLLSNAQTLFTVAEIKRLGIWDYFDDILISSEEHCKKPGSEFMQVLLNRHGLKVEESIMIGNEFGSDVAVADSVGMDSYYVHTNISGAPKGGEKATFTDLNTGYLRLSEIHKLL